MREETADRLSQAILRFMGEIDDILPAAKQSMEKEEFVAFSRAIGRVLVTLQDELMYSLYTEHPALRRPELFRLPDDPDRFRWSRRS